MKTVYVLCHKKLGMLGKSDLQRRTIFAFKSNKDAFYVKSNILVDNIRDFVWQEGTHKYRIVSPLQYQRRHCPLEIEQHVLDDLALQVSVRSPSLKIFVADNIEKLVNDDIILAGHTFAYHLDKIPIEKMRELINNDMSVSLLDP